MLRLGAFLMAIDEINNKTDGIADDLLPKTRLDFVLRDSRRDNLAALIGALELVGTCGVGHSGGSSGIVAATSILRGQTKRPPTTERASVHLLFQLL